MSLVKLRSNYINDITADPPNPNELGYWNKPFTFNLNDQIMIEPNSTVELVNFSCKLRNNPSVILYRNAIGNIAPCQVGLYDLTGAVYLGAGLTNVTGLYDGMGLIDFVDRIVDTINSITPLIQFTYSINTGTVNAYIALFWVSTTAAPYEIRLDIVNNYQIMGFTTGAILSDANGTAITGTMSATNPYQVSNNFQKNLSIELLNFGDMDSFDNVTKYKCNTIFFLPALNFEFIDSNFDPTVKFSPNTPLKIKLNNQYPIKANSLTIRIMTDVENNQVIEKNYAEIKTYCAMTLSFKKEGEN